MSDVIKAMDGVELAIRRVSEKLKRRTPWNMDVTDALDELADEIGWISGAAKQAASSSVPSDQLGGGA